MTPIKSALLDQKVVAGLGNIYVCEALYRSGISPKRMAGSISRPRIEKLTTEIRDTLQEAIEAGNTRQTAITAYCKEKYSIGWRTVERVLKNYSYPPYTLWTRTKGFQKNAWIYALM